MKFSKKHIFFPITVLITGLATMPTYPVNGSSSEEIFIDASEVLPVQPGTSQVVPQEEIFIDASEVLPVQPGTSQVVPQSVISQLSFSAQNAFRKGERVAIKSDTQPGKYEYRIVESVGRAIDRSNPQIEEPFREGKSVRARFFRLSDEPITRARKPEELGKLPEEGPKQQPAPLYPIGDVAPEALVKKAVFDKNNINIPLGEVVIVQRSDGTMRFGSVIYLDRRLSDMRGKTYYQVLVDTDTGVSKILPVELIGRISQ